MSDFIEGYRGDAPDARLREEKMLDYSHVDILGGAIPTLDWQEKTSWTTLDLRRQITSFSCGGQASAKIVTSFSHDRTVMSAAPIYRFRKNFPHPGMWMQDIGDALKNKRTSSEKDCQSQELTEDKMNAETIPDVLPFGISGYYFLPNSTEIDMDLIATALEKGHGVIFLINSNGTEWTDIPTYNGLVTTFSHYVSAVPKNYLLHDGEKSVVIDDSCNSFSTINQDGQRILTESFLKNRCYGVMALIPPPETPTEKTEPKHVFDTAKTYEYVPGIPQSFDPEVLALQKCLAHLGYLKDIFCIGFFGPKTKEAVINFQNEYKDFILVPAGLANATGIVSYHTLSFLNSRFGQS